MYFTFLAKSKSDAKFSLPVFSLQLLSRPQELSLHLNGKLALHLEGDAQTYKQAAPNFLKNFSPHHVDGQSQKRRYSLNELKTMLSNTKETLNNDGSLSSNEHGSYDKLYVREVRNVDKEATEKLQDKNLAVSTNSVQLGLDPPTSSIASYDAHVQRLHVPIHDHNPNVQNNEQEKSTSGKRLDLNNGIVVTSSHDVPGIDPPTQSVASLERLPVHAPIIQGDKVVYPAASESQSNQGDQPVGSHFSDQSRVNDQTKLLKAGVSKKSSSKKQQPELPRDYPLFETPYPPPLMDGHLCR